MKNYTPPSNVSPGLSKGQKKVVYILIGVVVAYYLWGWHKEHVLQYWPVAIFLLCPLMHIFMHGNHGGQGNHHPENHDGRKNSSHENNGRGCH